LAFDPNGRWLASGSYDGSVKVWDTATWAEPRTLVGHTERVDALAFDPNGRWLASGSYDESVKVWDTSTWAEQRTLVGHSGALAFDPHGCWLASGSDDASIKVWDTSTWAERHTLDGHGSTASIDVGRTVTELAFDARGRWLASGVDDGTVKVWETNLWEARATLIAGQRSTAITYLCFLGEEQFFCLDESNTLSLWEISDRKKSGIYLGLGGIGAALPPSGWDWFWSRVPIAGATTDGRLFRHDVQDRFPQLPIALGLFLPTASALGWVGARQVRAYKKYRQRLRPAAGRVEAFFRQAGCEVEGADVDQLTVQSASFQALAEFAPVTARLCLDAEQPDHSVVQELAIKARRKGRHTVAFLVYATPPGPVARALFPAVWVEDRVSIIPVELPAIEQRLTFEPDRCWDLLDSALKDYGPNADLFASTGQITDSLAFFGRGPILSQVRADLIRGQAIGFFGLRKAGKTSAMIHLAASLGEFPVVSLDLQGRDPVKFGTPVFNALLDRWGRLLEARTRVPAGVEPIAEGLSAVESAPIFRQRLLNLADRLKEAGFLWPLLLFLDEVERVIPRPDDAAYAGTAREFNAFFGVLRSLNQEERCLSLLIADLHADANRINYWPGIDVATNPVFSFFKEHYLPPFETDETVAMLDGIGRLMGYRFDETLTRAIHAESGGLPILSRQVASALIRRRKGEPTTPGQDALTLDARNRESLDGLFDLSNYLHFYCEGSIMGDMEAKGHAARGTSSACWPRPELRFRTRHSGTGSAGISPRPRRARRS
jgi:hypothetical protein